MDEWPPFRRVGSFDPFSDDPRWTPVTSTYTTKIDVATVTVTFPLSTMTACRFAIKTVELCPTSGLLLVGGIAGQLLFCRLECKKVQLHHQITCTLLWFSLCHLKKPS